MDEGPLRNYTLQGRTLIVSAIVVGVAVMMAYLAWVWDSLPQGTYPIWLFAMPGLLVGAVYFALGVVAFRLLGIRILKDRDRDDRGPGSESLGNEKREEDR